MPVHITERDRDNPLIETSTLYRNSRTHNRCFRMSMTHYNIQAQRRMLLCETDARRVLVL